MWKVTKLDKQPDKLVVRLEDLNGKYNPVLVEFDGLKRSYFWERWNRLRVSAKHYHDINQAIINYLTNDYRTIRAVI